jgi:hypothetical protein
MGELQTGKLSGRVVSFKPGKEIAKSWVPATLNKESCLRMSSTSILECESNRTEE